MDNTINNPVTSTTGSGNSTLSDAPADRIEIYPAPGNGDVPKRATRQARRDVPGAPGWQIAADGTPYRYDRRHEPTGRLRNKIDLGDNYTGPIPLAHEHVEWITDKSGHKRRKINRERFLDEIVYHAWYGPLPWRRTTIRHLDGNASNCAPANLVAVADGAFIKAANEKHTLKMMKPDVAGKKSRPQRDMPADDMTLFIESFSNDLKGWVPKGPIRKPKTETRISA